MSIPKTYHHYKGLPGNSYAGSIDQRLKLITDNYHIYEGLSGVDLGCSVGGFTQAPGNLGIRMTGIDFDEDQINIARQYASNKNTTWEVKDINYKLISTLDHDLVIWFSHFMWMVLNKGKKEALDSLKHIANKGMTLFFETSLGDGQAGKAMKAWGITTEKAIEDLLCNYFDHVTMIGYDTQWRNRPIFKCEKRINFPCYRGDEVYKIGNVVTKKQPEVYSNLEYHAIVKLCCNSYNKHTPIPFSTNGVDKIRMSYCGKRLYKLPKDYIEQGKEILEALKKCNLIHRDIQPRNLCIQDGVIKLIDFSCADHPDTEVKFKRSLNQRFRDPNGHNDEYSLNKSFEWLKNKYGVE